MSHSDTVMCVQHNRERENTDTYQRTKKKIQQNNSQLEKSSDQGQDIVCMTDKMTVVERHGKKRQTAHMWTCLVQWTSVRIDSVVNVLHKGTVILMVCTHTHTHTHIGCIILYEMIT
jgi:hypothetical protein